MKLSITPTLDFYRTPDGRLARVWDGVTQAGNPCRVLIAGFAVGDPAAQAEFDAAVQSGELRDLKPGQLLGAEPEPQPETLGDLLCRLRPTAGELIAAMARLNDLDRGEARAR